MNKAGLLVSTLATALLGGCLSQADEAPEFRVDRIERTEGRPYFVHGQLGKLSAPIDDVALAPEAMAGVLPAVAETLGVPVADLVATRAERDSLGMTHVRLAQQKNGLRVVGGDVIINIGADGVVQSVNSSALDRDLTASPSITAAAAAELAVAATEGSAEAKGSELTYLISNADGELYLAWQVQVNSLDGLARDRVYVDALSGRVVDRHPLVFTARNRTVRNGGGGEFPVTNAPIIGTETSAPTDPVGLAAYNNIGTTYDYFKTMFNRDSYNAAGAALNAQVHVAFGGSGNNAVWASDVLLMAFGDGDNQTFKPLAYSLDVTAHELTHAVTSASADLVYAGESGALNEAMSDILGSAAEAWKAGTVNANTWLLGEDVFTPNVAGDALRYMNDPTKDRVGTNQFYSRDYYPERFPTTPVTDQTDYGGVHINSGIANLAFYLMTTGGKHPKAKTANPVPGIGIEKAAAILYRTLTTKMGPNTNFAQARTLSETAAQELYAGSCAKTAVSAAWAAVGVGGAAPTDTVAPTASIKSPAEGAKILSGFQVEAEATDNLCIHKVELLVDGVVAQTLTAAPFTFTTDTALTKGSHMIEVKAYDAFNQPTTITRTITISGQGTGGGNGMGGGNGDGDGATADVTGGCSTGGSGGGLLLGLGLLGLVLRRRR